MRSYSSNAKMYAFATVFLIFFIALSILSLNVVKYRLFNSSKVMGQSIAARFIDKELKILIEYEVDEKISTEEYKLDVTVEENSSKFIN